MAHLPHVIFGLTAAALAGALWGSIAGFLKATVGAHEVITTIMLNWIAYWGGSYLFGRGGPLQNHFNKAVPISDDVAPGAKLAAIWGNPHLQALHVGHLHRARGARRLLHHPEPNDARLRGARSRLQSRGGALRRASASRATSSSPWRSPAASPGLAGGLDILGWQFRLGVLDVQVSNIGFIGIAVALLGRNTAVGVGLAALLFGGLLTGTSTRSLDPNIFPPQLAGNLALMIQALVLLFVGADSADPLHLAGTPEAPACRTRAAQPTRPA